MYMIFICSYFQKRNPHVSQLYPPYMFAGCIHSHFHLSLRDDILPDTQSGTQDSIRYVIDDNNRFPVPLPVAIPSKDIIHLQFTGVCTAHGSNLSQAITQQSCGEICPCTTPLSLRRYYITISTD